jgi:hypothetical protein
MHLGAVLADCVACGFQAQAQYFDPAPLETTSAKDALPDDAECIHHPGKTATEICAGSGDYICALCAITVDGKTYGAEYLDKGGRDKVAVAFDRHLERPDSTVVVLLLLLLPFNVVWVMLTPIWAPYGVYKLIQAQRLRQSDPLLFRVCSNGRLAGIWIFFLIVVLSCLVGFAGAAGALFGPM